MDFSLIDPQPIWLSLQLAGVTVLILLVLATPVAWWLAHTRCRFRLILLGPHGWVGGPVQALTGSSLSFSFAGLVFASCVYSLPFVVQPLHSAFESVGKIPLETAQSLGASRLDAFFSVISPLARRGYLTAIVLGFAHTLGEFGVVLMVGGNIPGKTKVISIEIYDRVEVLEYAQAHILSAGLLLFSFLVLVMVYSINRRLPVQVT